MPEIDDKIPFIRPEFPPLHKLTILFEQIYQNNYYTNNGPYYYKFKENIEEYFDNKLSACILANATLALILSLNILLKKNKTKVIIPSFTFAAGPLSIKWAGREPVFIDVERDTWQPKIDQAKNYIIENHDDIAGILLCNTFGSGNNAIGDWEHLAREYELPLIIDSAAGFGAQYVEGEKIGSRGDCEIFSLHATKPFGVGEGGVVLSHDDTFTSRLEEMKNFGFSQVGSVDRQGLNAKITEFSCAIGILLLPDLDKKVRARQNLLKKYKMELEKYGFEFQKNDELSTVAFVSTLVPSKMDRGTLIGKLKESNIESRSYYYPAVHNHAFFKNSEVLSMEVTNTIEKNIISLPADDKMSDNDFNRIISVITKQIQRGVA